MNLFEVSASLTLDTSSFIRSLRETRNGMNDSKKSLSEYRSDVAKLAQQFKQSGMTSSEAWKKAYSEIDKSLYNLGKDTTESGTKVKSFGEIFESLKDKFQSIKEKFSFLSIGVKDTTDKVSIFGDVLKANILSDAISKGFDMIVDGFKRVGSAAVGFMKNAVNAGQNFDSAMSQVAATMGKSVDEIQNLRDFAQQMGATTKYSATESAQALNYMALAGYDAETSMKMLPNVMNLASAGAFDLARASDMLTDTQTAFGISLERTNQLVDEMAKAASTGNTSVEQLGDAFLTIGGLAKELNGGMVTLKDGTQKEVDGVQELEIALTSMANAGIKGSVAGTHMRNMLLKLSAPTEDATKFFEQYGIQIFDTAGNMNSLRDIFGQLNTQLSSMTQGDKLAAISDIFNARDTASAEALLAAIGEDWDKIGDAIVHAEGAASKMAQTQIKNLEGAKTLAKSALEGFQIVISDALNPILTDFVSFGGNALSMLTKGFKNNKLTGVGAALKIITRKLSDTVKKNAPILVNGFTDITKTILKSISENAETLADTGQIIVDSIISGITATLPDTVKTGGKIIASIGKGLAKSIPKLIEQTTQTVLKIAEALTDPESNAEMADSGLSLLEALGYGIKNAIPIVLNRIPAIVDNIKTTFSDNKEKIKEVATTLMTEFGESMEGKSFVEVAETIISGIADTFGIREKWAKVKEKIEEGIQNIDFAKITENISQLIIGVTDATGNLIDGIDWSVIGGAIGEALNGVDWYGIIDSLLGAISTVMENAPELFKGIAETIDSETALQIATIGINLLTGKQIIAGIASYIKGTTAFTTVSTALSGMLAKCAPVVGAAIVGWDIGTKIRNEIDDIELFDESVNEVIDGIRENVAKLRAGIESLWTGDYEKSYRDAISAMYETGKGFASKKYNDAYMQWAGEYNADKIAGIQSLTMSYNDVLTDPDTSLADYIEYYKSSGAYMWGQDFTQNFADGISENSSKVYEALDEMNQGISDTNEFSVPKKGILSTADTWMPDMMQLFADGIKSNIPLVMAQIEALTSNLQTKFSNGTSETQKAWDSFWASTKEKSQKGTIEFNGIIQAIPNKFREIIAGANHWGSDIISNFINSAKSKWDEWNSTWEDFGGVIYDLLHHSTPEKGLLKNDDEWMPDMMDNFISGIRDNIPALRGQAENAVSAIQTAFTSPIEMGNIEEINIPELPKLEYDESELEYNASPTVEVHTSLIDTVTKKLDEIGNRIIDVVVNGDFGIDMPKLQPQTIDIESRFNGFEIPQLPDFETEDIQIEVTFLDNLAELLEKFRSFKNSLSNTVFDLNGNLENIDIPAIDLEIPDFEKLSEKKSSIETTEIRNFREVYENEAYYTRVSETDRKAPYKPQQQSMQNNTNDDMQAVIGLLNGILNALQEREIVMPIDTLDTALGLKQSNETRWAMA